MLGYSAPGCSSGGGGSTASIGRLRTGGRTGGNAGAGGIGGEICAAAGRIFGSSGLLSGVLTACTTGAGTGNGGGTTENPSAVCALAIPDRTICPAKRAAAQRLQPRAIPRLRKNLCRLIHRR